MNKILLLLISTVIFSCTTTVDRPKITGVVVDEVGIPVDSCKVGETLTDKNGRFVLPEKIHYGFIHVWGRLPIMIQEDVTKKGYEQRRLETGCKHCNPPVGTVWEVDTIHLKKIKTDFSSVNLKDIWLAGLTKNADTLYMTKKNQVPDDGRVDFIGSHCNTYSAGYYYGMGNLPRNVFERHIELDLSGPALKARRILIYGNPATSEKTKYDTIYTKGKWMQNDKIITLYTSLPEINGIYKVVDFNDTSIQLVKKR